MGVAEENPWRIHAELRQADDRDDPRLLPRSGLNIALCSDLRIAADDARLGIPAAKMGLGYRASSMKNLVDTVGPPFAREIMITGRQFTADEAKYMGFVHSVAPVDELEALVREYCEMISENAPLTMRASKRIIREL